MKTKVAICLLQLLPHYLLRRTFAAICSTLQRMKNQRQQKASFWFENSAPDFAERQKARSCVLGV
ncbi:MAG: hypothetical protein DKT66_25405 [Candidatus Melainabacteria bacterium]|nr:MAG: hypothetical protein DKT66_25405 [Candidatus Melainabacteria bacterium]